MTLVFLLDEWLEGEESTDVKLQLQIFLSDRSLCQKVLTWRAGFRLLLMTPSRVVGDSRGVVYRDYLLAVARAVAAASAVGYQHSLWFFKS